jgi:dUTPase
MIIAKHETIRWTITDSLNSTERGEGGYGSTGKQP